MHACRQEDKHANVCMHTCMHVGMYVCLDGQIIMVSKFALLSLLIDAYFGVLDHDKRRVLQFWTTIKCEFRNFESR